MNYRQFGTDFILRFDKGELFVENLLKFFKERSIHPAWVNGLGAALWAEVGFYNLDKQEYGFKKIETNLEIANITGNVTWTDNQPKAHLHVVLADANGQTYAGHLNELAVGGTCEIRLKTFDEALSRRHDDSSGLDILDL